jgi:uncharacterized small protein (TIGR04563 family)
MPARPRRRRSKFARSKAGPVRRHSIYFPVHILAEIGAEAMRLDRSLSWMVQHAWRIARAEIAGDRSTPPPSLETPSSPAHRAQPRDSSTTFFLVRR